MLKWIIAIGCIAAVSANILPEEQNNGDFQKQSRILKTSADRIRGYGYPVEEHTVQTSDAYILKLFRIPYSPKLKNQQRRQKPVAFLQHGLLSSSDCWLLNGPDNALAYLLADAGYDVWLGNSRGNVYSRHNAKKSPLLPPFWDFSWNEVGIYDLPAMIDYVLYMTDEDALHYVGHSQGTTSFMVLTSTIPRYNLKFKTTHMLAPVGYMNHMESPLAKVAGPLLGHPSILSALMGSNEFMPNNDLMDMLGAQMCKDKSIFQPLCANVLFLICGWDSKHLNYTLLSDVMESHPAGSSTSQLIHYLQEYESGYFRRYDHGSRQNKKEYKQKTPTEYLVNNIRPPVPVQFYYSDNDYFAAVVDVLRMAAQLGANVELYHVKYTDWNHLDYLWALEVKSELYDRIIALADEYENKY